MRILFLSTWFPFPADNGSKIRVKYLIHALAKQHEVTFLSFAFATAQPKSAQGSFCKSIKTVNIDPFEENKASEIRRFLSFSPMAYRPIDAMQQLVSTTLAESLFDVVIASTELMAVYALQAKKETKKVLEEHNSLTRQMRERYETSRGSSAIRNWLSWQKTRRYEGRLFNQFDRVAMVSQQDLETSEQKLPGFKAPVALIPNGVDCTQNHPGLAAKQPHLLIFNGSLTYEANLDGMKHFLSQIYPLIRAQIPDVKLTITGSTKGVNLGDLALDDSVSLTGYVEDIRFPVAEAASCVVPLKQGGGTRLKILEAMALGTPVISTSKGAEGLMAVDGEHLMIADDPHDFAWAVIELLGNTALQEKLSTSARKLVEENYDWGQIGERFVTMVENVVTSAPALQTTFLD